MCVMRNQGVRQSRIKICAVNHSCGGYLIFVDHDVVLHPRFVEDHVSNGPPGFSCRESACCFHEL